MPRQETRQVSRRGPVDPRSTFDYTTPGTHITAQPTDPYVYPGSDPSGLGKLVTALSTINPALRSFAQFSQQQYERDFRDGQLSRAIGDERPDTGQARIRGWEQLDGELAARRDYRNEIAQFVAQNGTTMTPEEFQQGIQEISRKYLDGATEYFQRGFVSTALSVEDQALTSYEQLQQQIFHDEGLDRIAQKAEDEVSGMIERYFGDMLGVANLDEVVGNASLYETLRNVNFGVLFSREMRSILSDTQALGKDLGIHRSDVSEIYLDRVGQMAVRLGLPELLEFAKAKDDSGVSLEGGLLGDKVHRYREQAERARQSYIDANDRALEEQRKATQQRLINETWAAITDITLETDPRRAAQLAEQLYAEMEEDAYKDLPPETFRILRNALRDVIQRRDQFPSLGDSGTYARLFADGLVGALTFDDVRNAHQAGLLTETWYKTLMDSAAANQRARDAEEAGLETEKRNERRSMIRQEHAALLDFIEGTEQIGLIEDHELRASAMFTLNDAYERWLASSDGSWNLLEYRKEVVEPVLREFGISYTKTRQNVGEVQRPGILDQDPDVVMAEFEEQERTEGNFFTRLARDVGRRFGLLKRELPPEAAWSYNAVEAFDRLSVLYDSGFTVPEIRTLLEEREEPPEAIDYYVESYAFNLARLIREFDRFRNDPLAAGRYIEEVLSEIGYSPDEIEKAIVDSRFTREVIY